jgi:diaminohydroxyphosphoribosylaminopyrimidine deaminase/5-amino-6-(5-phosphoribosylamino)uracil reductase
MTTSEAERRAMRRALELAVTPGVPLGPNPRVGCVLLAPDGTTVAEGFHRRAGGPHAEVVALAEAGEAARGATAVVTLEPCNHTGRTGPCSEALIAAGVARVVFAQPDTNPVAIGGAGRLRDAGIEVVGGVMVEEARAINRTWTFAIAHQRPFVTWKFATTLDGRSAAADGTSRWVSSRAARLDTHRLRALCDTMLVGTNTVAVDDPELTVRDEVGEPLPHQPLRAVMGMRDIPLGRRVFNDRAETLQLRTREPREALATLFALDRQHVFLEGGPTLARAFLEADLVDDGVA